MYSCKYIIGNGKYGAAGVYYICTYVSWLHGSTITSSNPSPLLHFCLLYITTCTLLGLHWRWVQIINKWLQLLVTTEAPIRITVHTFQSTLAQYHGR